MQKLDKIKIYLISEPFRFDQAIAKIVAANAQNPNHDIFEGKFYPRELLYAQRMTVMLESFAPDAAEAVQLAIRAQHISRWIIPRHAYSIDLTGYKNGARICINSMWNSRHRTGKN